MQRRLIDRFGAERRLGWPFPYGIIETRLSPDALENHSVRFTRLSAVLPSGAYVNVPEDTNLPPLNIKQAYESSPSPFIVYLGVPVWQADRGNTVEKAAGSDWRPKRLYHVTETQVNDENTGENPQPVELRRLNARLLLEGDDRTDLEVLPVLRIVRSTRQEAGLPMQDPDFTPPCLVLAGSGALRTITRDLANQVDATRKELMAVMARSKFNADAMQGKQFEQVLRLRTLMRYTASLPPLADAPAVTPFEVFMELGRLLGELVALHPETELDLDMPAYDHLNPAVAFQDLNIRIRRQLPRDMTDRVLEVPFVDGEGKLTRLAALKPEHLTLPNEYFLGVKSKQDPRAVVAQVEDADSFKLTTRKLVDKAYYGLRLQEERHPPVVLQTRVGTTYFRVSRVDASARVWEEVKKDKELAVKWKDIQNSDFQLTLYMTIPEPTAAKP